MSLLAALGLALGTLALGDFVLRALAPSARGFERFGLGAAAGLALGSIALYVPLAATGRVHFAPLALLQAAALIAAPPRVVRDAQRARSQSWISALVFALVVLGVLRVAVQTPFSAYDDRAIYGLKGKALWLERDLDGPVFRDLEVVHYHRDYELGLPLLIAYAAWASDPAPSDPQGRETAPSAEAWVDRYDAVATWAPWSVLWPAALAALAAALAVRARELGRLRPLLLPLSLPLAIVFPWLPGDSWSLSGADLPLTLLVGGVAWCVVAWWTGGERRWLVLAGLLAAASFLIKKDAALTYSCALVAALVARAPRPGWVAPLATLGLLGLVVLTIRSAGLPVPEPAFEEDYVRALREGDPRVWMARLPLIATHGGRQLMSSYMGLHWLAVCAVAVPLGLARGGWRRFLALWVLLHVAADVAIFAVTPDMVVWHVSTAFTRLLCHVAVPAGMLLVDWGTRVALRVRAELAPARPGLVGGVRSQGPA